MLRTYTLVELPPFGFIRKENVLSVNYTAGLETILIQILIIY